MANTYCVAPNTGIGFITHQDRSDFNISGHPGDVWAVDNTAAGISWINRIEGTAKLKAEAQAIVDAKIAEAQAAWDASSETEQALRARPTAHTLP